MNSFTHNVTAADMIARQTIAERVQQAEQRAQVRAARAARREARRAAMQASQPRPVAPPQTHDLPWWAFRFVRPVH
jgi:lysozyme family protein